MKHLNQRIFRLTMILLLTTLSIPAIMASSKEAHLIIVGPGDPLYTYWGHIGIALSDEESGINSFYDFGNFSFYSDNFYSNFIMGRMLYLGMETPTNYFISYSLTEDRDFKVYPLNLGAEEMEILESRLNWWMQPENREYLYDYFHANCSTIIRDILDEAVGGVLRDESQEETGLTFRSITRTGTDPSLISEVALHYLLGSSVDYEINEWELMFLPQAVADKAIQLEYRSRDGETRILAGNPVIMNESTRKPLPRTPGILWPVMLLAGFVFSVIWILAGRDYEKRGLRISMKLLRVLITLIIGVPGIILGFMMFFTNHSAIYNNINFWPTIPTVLAGLVFIIRNSEADERKLSWLWTLNLAGLLLVIVARGTGLSAQDAFAFWAFYLPFLLTASRPGLWLREKLIRKAD